MKVSKRDRVAALPSHLETTHLRVYLINLEHKILILGNGGLKTSRTYQEDPHLKGCVEVLQKIDIQIKEKEQKKEITINGTALLGALTFTIDEDETNQQNNG